MIRAAFILLPFGAFAQCECIGTGYDIVILPNGAYLPSDVIYEIADTAVVWKNGNEVSKKAARYIVSLENEHRAENEQKDAEISALETANAENVKEVEKAAGLLQEKDEKLKRWKPWQLGAKITSGIAVALGIAKVAQTQIAP